MIKLLQSSFVASIAIFTLLCFGLMFQRKSSMQDRIGMQHRVLQQEEPNYYFTLTDTAVLGRANPDVAVGNPLKGLASSPDWTGDTTPARIPTSLEFYYIGLDEIMYGSNQFDWTFLDNTLFEAASRYKHVIWRVYCHYPGRPLAVPKYLLDQNVPIVNGSPVYDDTRILVAIEQFITALGLRYDGNKSLAFIQMGLLGYWGEWHTYPETGLLSDETKQKVLAWYRNAFKVTKLQTRDPGDAPGAQVGFHDDSFGFYTIGPIHWYFWPKVLETSNGDAWKRNVIGGETKPNLQAVIFEPTYQPDVYKNKADFMECVKTTHATYMIHGDAFKDAGYEGTELQNARFAHARMGYNYIVTRVGVLTTASNTVAIDVTLMQIGVAPFYYPLSLALTCTGLRRVVGGVEKTMADRHASTRYRFENIPVKAECLQQITVQLESRFTYRERPIKFAQGKGSVSFSIPLPEGMPTGAPTKETPSVSRPAVMLVSMPNNQKTRLWNNMIINLANYQSVSIAAEPDRMYHNGSVVFLDNGIAIQTENGTPFTITGESGGQFIPWNPTLGDHTIEAIPYIERNGRGSAGLSEKIKVTFIRQNSAPGRPPVYVPPPTSYDSRDSTVALTLLNADKNSVIQRMKNGTAFSISRFPNVNIRADISSTLSINRVEFRYNNKVTRIEYVGPYIFCGNSGPEIIPWKPTLGNHTVAVKAFLNGSARELARTIRFTVRR